MDILNNTSSEAFSFSNPFDSGHVTTAEPRDQTVSSHVTVASREASFLPWDNPDNLMTLEQQLLTAMITNCVLSPLLLVIGAPTNLASCFVFYKQGLKDRMNLCLFVLALVDTTFLASSFVVCFNSFIAFWDNELARKYYAEALVYFGWVMFGSKAVSGCISMVVAVERCVCVVFPLRASSIMRTRTMGAILAVIIILCSLASSVSYISNTVISVPDPASGEAHYIIVVTDFFVKHKLIYDIIYDILLSFSLPIISLVVVGVTTAITVIKLRTAMAWRASTSSGRADNHSQQQQAALTKMLVILSCVFMACSAPLTGMSVARLLVPDYSLYGRYSNFFYASHIVAVHFITPLNSAVNFFVYYSRSSRFRQELKMAFACCGKGETNSKDTNDLKTSLSTVVSEY